MHKHLNGIVAALLASGGLAGCGGGDASGSVQVAGPQPVSMTLTAAIAPVPMSAPTPTPALIRPSADNTGFPTGMTLRPWTGPGYDGRANLIIDGFDLPAPPEGYYTFAGNNVVLRNCRIRAGVLFAGDNVRIERCEIIGGVSLSGTDKAVVEYNNIHDISDDGMHVTSDSGPARNVSIAHNFVHSFVYPPAIACSDPHSDGIQVRGVNKLTLFNNVFDMGPWQVICDGRYNPLSAAIFLESANGGNRNVTVDRNYLNGSAIVARIGPGPNTRFTNNRFGRDERYGLIHDTSRRRDIVDKSGNARDDTGEPVIF